ncbi:hypothetical protein DWX31_01875 [Hungatella hathewayi]|uniref:Uncharacterized protein n=1 Tax=Hungatella hathewayi TaxID=154046 RepID=A0A3E3DTZ0_9FIRM|nr:hypothetical protein DWX31_01875 [Hungatella hathewayi]
MQGRERLQLQSGRKMRKESKAAAPFVVSWQSCFSCLQFFSLRGILKKLYKSIVFRKKRLTNPDPYDIVIGRMEELRSFFYAQNYVLRQRGA